MKLKKIDRKNIPHNFPVTLTGMLILWFDYYNASDFMWGVLVVFLFIWWGLSFLDIALSDSYDLLKDIDEKEKNR